MRRFLILLLLLLAGCAADRPAGGSAVEPAATTTTAPAATTTTAPAEPQTKEAAHAAIERSTEAYAAGDWAGAWDEWTPQAKRRFSRRDYITLHTRCKTLTGIPFKIKAVRVEGTTATVRTERASFLFTSTLRYINGRWYFQPDVEDRANYALGLDRLLKKRRAEGSCL
jgi:hypothetical protein